MRPIFRTEETTTVYKKNRYKAVRFAMQHYEKTHVCRINPEQAPIYPSYFSDVRIKNGCWVTYQFPKYDAAQFHAGRYKMVGEDASHLPQISPLDTLVTHISEYMHARLCRWGGNAYDARAILCGHFLNQASRFYSVEPVALLPLLETEINYCYSMSRDDQFPFLFPSSSTNKGVGGFRALVETIRQDLLAIKKRVVAHISQQTIKEVLSNAAVSLDTFTSRFAVFIVSVLCSQDCTNFDLNVFKRSHYNQNPDLYTSLKNNYLGKMLLKAIAPEGNMPEINWDVLSKQDDLGFVEFDSDLVSKELRKTIFLKHSQLFLLLNKINCLKELLNELSNIAGLVGDYSITHTNSLNAMLDVLESLVGKAVHSALFEAKTLLDLLDPIAMRAPESRHKNWVQCCFILAEGKFQELCTFQRHLRQHFSKIQSRRQELEKMDSEDYKRQIVGGLMSTIQVIDRLGLREEYQEQIRVMEKASEEEAVLDHDTVDLPVLEHSPVVVKASDEKMADATFFFLLPMRNRFSTHLRDYFTKEEGFFTGPLLPHALVNKVGLVALSKPSVTPLVKWRYKDNLDCQEKLNASLAFLHHFDSAVLSIDRLLNFQNANRHQFFQTVVLPFVHYQNLFLDQLSDQVKNTVLVFSEGQAEALNSHLSKEGIMFEEAGSISISSVLKYLFHSRLHHVQDLSKPLCWIDFLLTHFEKPPFLNNELYETLNHALLDLKDFLNQSIRYQRYLEASSGEVQFPLTFDEARDLLGSPNDFSLQASYCAQVIYSQIPGFLSVEGAKLWRAGKPNVTWHENPKGAARAILSEVIELDEGSDASLLCNQYKQLGFKARLIEPTEASRSHILNQVQVAEAEVNLEALSPEFKRLFEHAEKLIKGDVAQSCLVGVRGCGYFLKGELKGLALKEALIEFLSQQENENQLMAYLSRRHYDYRGVSFSLFSCRDVWGRKSKTQKLAEKVGVR